MLNCFRTFKFTDFKHFIIKSLTLNSIKNLLKRKKYKTVTIKLAKSINISIKASYTYIYIDTYVCIYVICTYYIYVQYIYIIAFNHRLFVIYFV